MERKIAFIGVGNMADAIISGIMSQVDNTIKGDDIILYNRHREKISRYECQNMYIASSVYDAVERADCVILAVKPQNFPEVLPLISEVPEVDKKLFISIAAGVSIKTICDMANASRVVRVMPNTPMMVGKGVSAICRSKAVSDDEFDFAASIFKASGDVISINEDEMNRIISVTGSSPAYVFMFIKAIYNGAVDQGLLKFGDSDSSLSERELLDAICNTVIGAAQLMKQGNKTPDEQIKTVCSKGGTTEKAVDHLISCDFESTISDAMKKCTERADELSRN